MSGIIGHSSQAVSQLAVLSQQPILSRPSRSGNQRQHSEREGETDPRAE